MGGFYDFCNDVVVIYIYTPVYIIYIVIVTYVYEKYRVFTNILCQYLSGLQYELSFYTT